MGDIVYEFRPRATQPVGRCSTCGRTMVSAWSWKMGDRRGAQTYARSLRSGLCRACLTRKSRSPKPRRAPDMSSVSGRSKDDIIRDHDEMLDEYAMIRPSCGTIRQAAERMGVSFARLEKACYRARQRGDSRGNPPQQQAERALQRGAPFGRKHPHHTEEAA